MVAVEQPAGDDMAALDQAHTVLRRLAEGAGQGLAHPGAAGIDDAAGRHFAAGGGDLVGQRDMPPDALAAGGGDGGPRATMFRSEARRVGTGGAVTGESHGWP